jgi:uncharacterized protein YkuJ
MRKTILMFTVIAASLTACQKKNTDTDNMITYAARYGQTVIVPSTDFEVEVEAATERANDDMAYTSGMLAYKVNGEVVASIDFSHGNELQALVVKQSGEEIVALGEGDNGDKWDYKKVIVEPLVYSEECGYVVSGIIKFYKDEIWVATFDYGDGACEDLITKYTEDNSAGFVFSMNDYPEFNK